MCTTQKHDMASLATPAVCTRSYVQTRPLVERYVECKLSKLKKIGDYEELATTIHVYCKEKAENGPSTLSSLFFVLSSHSFVVSNREN
jgi:hypothetical protein